MVFCAINELGDGDILVGFLVCLLVCFCIG